MRHPLALLSAVALLAAGAIAQITYVDANPATNTTLADGSPWVVTTNASGTDGMWAARTSSASNLGTVYEANGGGAPGEDCAMLRTTIRGLIPGRTYATYAYFWGISTQRWRGAALQSDTQPVGAIQVYNTNHFNGSAFQPMQALDAASFLGYQQASLGLSHDVDLLESSGHFGTVVKITDNTGYLFEVPAGSSVADADGEIDVYIDDLPFQTFNDRTWYDGVGYQLAPQQYGQACGAPLPQIGSSGADCVGRALTVEVDGAVNAPALLVAGFSDQQWLGASLPLDLQPLGFGAGCLLNASADVTLAAFTDGAGHAGVPVAFPPLPVPASSLYCQWATLTAAGFQFSAGLRTLAPVPDTRYSPIGLGWARNSVNSPIFRYNAVTSHNGFQYVAYYDATSHVVLARRALGSDVWQTSVTQYTGNTSDAHNSISIIVDGNGYLHMSWDHHGSSLRYARGIAPGSLTLGSMQSMVGSLETSLTYPEFHRLADGSLIFLYRLGSSGNGNVVMNRYSLASQTWSRVHDNLISGQGLRNAYWQTCTDELGNIHLSWVWRENGNANSNHDIGYAVSSNGGTTWRKTNGQAYAIPITAASAEYAVLIPQQSDLMNQTSMSADSQGRPYIVNYWTPAGQSVPQYHVVYHDGAAWHVSQITDRGLDFSVSGTGSLALPCSRPKIVVDSTPTADRAVMIFRDDEYGSVITAMISDDLSTGAWRMRHLTNWSVDKWEPNFDTEVWKASKQLHIYAQRVGQGPNETLSNTSPKMVGVLEWTPW